MVMLLKTTCQVHVLLTGTVSSDFGGLLLGGGSSTGTLPQQQVNSNCSGSSHPMSGAESYGPMSGAGSYGSSGFLGPGSGGHGAAAFVAQGLERAGSYERGTTAHADVPAVHAVLAHSIQAAAQAQLRARDAIYAPAAGTAAGGTTAAGMPEGGAGGIVRQVMVRQEASDQRTTLDMQGTLITAFSHWTCRLLSLDLPSSS